jgi:cell division protein FtsB
MSIRVERLVHQRWALAFLIWFLFLTGLIGTYAGSPGIVQLLRLRNLHDEKQGKIAQLKKEIQVNETMADLLTHSRVAQEKEVRRVLGYAARDEIIFDFSSSHFY